MLNPDQPGFEPDGFIQVTFPARYPDAMRSVWFNLTLDKLGFSTVNHQADVNLGLNWLKKFQ